MTSPQGTKICLGYNSGEKGGEGGWGEWGGGNRGGGPIFTQRFSKLWSVSFSPFYSESNSS